MTNMSLPSLETDGVVRRYVPLDVPRTTPGGSGTHASLKETRTVPPPPSGDEPGPGSGVPPHPRTNEPGKEHFSIWLREPGTPAPRFITAWVNEVWPEFDPDRHYDFRQPSRLRPLLWRGMECNRAGPGDT